MFHKTDSGRRLRLPRLLRFLSQNILGIIGIMIILSITFLAVFAELVTSFPPNQQDSTASELSVGAPGHWLGTDQFGRDTWSRLVYGARISLTVGISVVLLTVVFGVLFGLLAGYYKRLDTLIMRSADILFAFPDIILALLVIAILGSSLVNIVIAISIWSTPACARIVRGSVLELKNRDYVTTIKALGGSDFRILVRHILPNASAPLIVFATMRIATAILSTASLSYLGLGAQPPTPEWGAMVSDGQQYIYTLPHLIIVPGVAIALSVFAFNVVGDALRDKLDPNLAI